MICPSPWQVGQGRVTVRNPCDTRWRPRPPHAGQVFGFVPGSAPLPSQVSQRSSREIAIGASTPKAASRNAISMR